MNELNYRICRLDEVTGDEIFLAACEYFSVAEEIAETLSWTIWQGHRVAVFVMNEQEPTVSFKK